MFSLVLILHVFVCLLIIFFVLMQSGRGAELGAAFGGVGQAQSTRSEMSGIGKATTVVAVLFMLTSLVLAYLSSEKARESVVRDIKAVPAVPGVEEPVLPANEIQIPADGVFVPPNEEEVPSKDLEQTAAPALTPSTEPTQEVNNLQKAAPHACTRGLLAHPCPHQVFRRGTVRSRFLGGQHPERPYLSLVQVRS